MSNYVVWVDSEKAHVFALTTSGVVKSHLEKRGADHHTHNKKDHHGDSNLEHFFRDLAVLIKEAEGVLILGPGRAKTDFKTHLETHHAAGLAAKVVGVEASDHPTDNQILATARTFFKGYDLFNKPI